MNNRSSQSGLTLIEILVASAIGGVVAITVGSLFTFTMRQFATLVLQNQTQQELQWMSYQLQSLFSQSVENNLVTSTSTNSYKCEFWGDSNGCGNCLTPATCNNPVKVSHILTDRALGFMTSSGSLSDEIKDVTESKHASYVYFIEPYHNQPGVLCIIFSLDKAGHDRKDAKNLHNDACKVFDTDHTVIEVESYASGFKLLGFEFKVKKNTSSESMIIDITLHNRYFLGGNPKSKKLAGKDGGYRFCDSEDPKCLSDMNWKDLKHKLSVNLRNNIFKNYDGSDENWKVSRPDQVVAKEGSFGKILFYQMALPANSYITRGR